MLFKADLRQKCYLAPTGIPDLQTAFEVLCEWHFPSVFPSIQLGELAICFIGVAFLR